MVTRHSKQYLSTGLSDLGAKLIILVFVFSQFVEVSLYTSENFIISLQKVVAIFLLPIALLFMRRIRANGYLTAFAILLFTSYTISYILKGNIAPEVAVAAVSTLMGFVGAVMLYTALAFNVPRNIQTLAKIWIFFSVMTAMITFLQSLGLLPLFTVPYEYIRFREATTGLYRGTGLKFDPNFQALMLVIGLTFTIFYPLRNWIRFALQSIIVLGIVGTFSRMGLLLAVLTLVLGPILQSFGSKKRLPRALIGATVYAILVLVIGFALYAWGPVSIRTYLEQRFDSIGAGISILFSDENPETTAHLSHLSSAEARALLAKAALTLALRHWLVGVGAYQTDQVIYEYIGIPNVAHNTYLEQFIIGGILGLLSIFLYAWILTQGLWFKCSLAQIKIYRNALLVLVMVFAVAGFFLSLSYNSVIWLPLAIALAIRKWSRECI